MAATGNNWGVTVAAVTLSISEGFGAKAPDGLPVNAAVDVGTAVNIILGEETENPGSKRRRNKMRWGSHISTTGF